MTVVINGGFLFVPLACAYWKLPLMSYDNHGCLKGINVDSHPIQNRCFPFYSDSFLTYQMSSLFLCFRKKYRCIYPNWHTVAIKTAVFSLKHLGPSQNPCQKWVPAVLGNVSIFTIDCKLLLKFCINFSGSLVNISHYESNVLAMLFLLFQTVELVITFTHQNWNSLLYPPKK